LRMDPMRSGPRNGSNPVFAVGGQAIAWAAVGVETSASRCQVGKMTKSAIWDCISGFCGVETNVP
jgi:purine-cytosine permease-like protein